jgi:predicted Zn-dependent peptidase
LATVSRLPIATTLEGVGNRPLGISDTADRVSGPGRTLSAGLTDVNNPLRRITGDGEHYPLGGSSHGVVIELCKEDSTEPAARTQQEPAIENGRGVAEVVKQAIASCFETLSTYLSPLSAVLHEYFPGREAIIRDPGILQIEKLTARDYFHLLVAKEEGYLHPALHALAADRFSLNKLNALVFNAPFRGNHPSHPLLNLMALQHAQGIQQITGSKAEAHIRRILSHPAENLLTQEEQKMPDEKQQAIIDARIVKFNDTINNAKYIVNDQVAGAKLQSKIDALKQALILPLQEIPKHPSPELERIFECSRALHRQEVIGLGADLAQSSAATALLMSSGLAGMLFPIINECFEGKLAPSKLREEWDTFQQAINNICEPGSAVENQSPSEYLSSVKDCLSYITRRLASPAHLAAHIIFKPWYHHLPWLVLTTTLTAASIALQEGLSAWLKKHQGPLTLEATKTVEAVWEIKQKINVLGYHKRAIMDVLESGLPGPTGKDENWEAPGPKKFLDMSRKERAEFIKASKRVVAQMPPEHRPAELGGYFDEETIQQAFTGWTDPSIEATYTEMQGLLDLEQAERKPREAALREGAAGDGGASEAGILSWPLDGPSMSGSQPIQPGAMTEGGVPVQRGEQGGGWAMPAVGASDMVPAVLATTTATTGLVMMAVGGRMLRSGLPSADNASGSPIGRVQGDVSPEAKALTALEAKGLLPKIEQILKSPSWQPSASQWKNDILDIIESAGILTEINAQFDRKNNYAIEAHLQEEGQASASKHIAKRHIAADSFESMAMETAFWVAQLVYEEMVSPIAQYRSSELDMAYQWFRLPNGVQVIMKQDDTESDLVIQAWHDVGGKNDGSHPGIAHMLEHLMFEGNDYRSKFKAMGGTIDAETGYDYTAYKHVVAPKHVAKALALHAERLKNELGFVDESDLDNVRTDVLKERDRRDTPELRASGALREALFPKGHPYHDSDTIGSQADIQAISLQDIKDWFKATYSPDGLVLVLVGNVDPVIVRHRVSSHFDSFVKPEAEAPARARPSPPVPSRSSTRAEVTDGFAQHGLIRGWLAPPSMDPAFNHLELVAQLLSGRLVKARIEGAGLVSSYVTAGVLGSIFTVDAKVESKQVMSKIEDEIENQLTDLANNGPGEEELANTKEEYIQDYNDFYLDSGADEARYLGECTTRTGTPDCLTVKDISVNDIKATAHRWLVENGSHTLRLIPFNYAHLSQAIDDVSSHLFGNFNHKTANNIGWLLEKSAAILSETESLISKGRISQGQAVSLASRIFIINDQQIPDLIDGVEAGTSDMDSANSIKRNLISAHQKLKRLIPPVVMT